MDRESPACSVILIGDSGVGKTSIISRLCRNTFSGTELPTSHSGTYESYRLAVGDKFVNLQLWDTAGQEKFRSLGSLHYRRASCCIIAFALDSLESFQSVDYWYLDFLQVVGGDVPVYLVGNKVDGPLMAIQDQQIEDWAAKRNCQSFKTSARLGIGIHEVFSQIAKDFAQSQAATVTDTTRPVVAERDRCC
jgi:small GTP-binding protein